MKSTIRSLLSPWIPPALRQLWQRPPRPGIDFHGQYASWERAVAASEGYDQGRILQKVKAATLKVERGEAAYERDGVVFDKVETYWPVLSALLWAAARDGGCLSVLDFGGSLGTTYRQNRSFLDHLADVRWGVVEQPHYAASGRQHFTTDRLSFHETIDECVAAI
jgi:putative methyltransferase (TIGR04325 family)